MYEMKYSHGTIVWCRPTLADQPIQGIYVRSITENEHKQGYRPGEIVE